MCEPVSAITATQLAIASVVASSAASLATYAQQSQSASRQSGAAQDAYDSQVSQARNQQVLTAQASGAQQSERARQAMIETAHLQALASESGTNGGGSNDRVTNEANFNAGTDLATMQLNEESSQRQIIGNVNEAYAQAQQRGASIQTPSLIGTGLQIAGAGLSSYSQLEAAKARAAGNIGPERST